MSTRSLAFGALAAAVLFLAGCGYHVSGHADALPKDLKTIAVTAFSNRTTHYRLTERMPAAIAREFIARTRYNVVADPNGADAVLSGSVLSYAAYPTTFDPQTGRASALQIYLHLQLTLRDRNGNILFSRPDFEMRDRYEISTDQRAYLDESDVAVDRMSKYVARMVVSAVLEKF